MTDTVPRSLVEAFYKAYAARDIEKIAAFLDDEVEWAISGPVDVLHYCGVYHGKAAVLDLFQRRIPELLQVYNFVPNVLVVDGDRASTLVRLSARRTDDGRIISYRIANFIRFRDGKLVENISLIDSFDAVEQVIGHPLSVHDGHTADAGNLVPV